MGHVTVIDDNGGRARTRAAKVADFLAAAETEELVS